MAESKKSFILYTDLIHTIEKMPPDKAGELFKHILRYVNDLNPETQDLLIELTFEPIKQQLKRDLMKWQGIKETRSESGKLGGRPKKQEEANKANAFSEKQNEAKKAVSVNVTVNDIVTVNVKKDIEERKREFYNSLTPFLGLYSKELLRDFYEYWTEHGDNDKKFRKEKENSFSVERRLSKWKLNEDRFSKEKSSAKKENRIDKLKEQHLEQLRKNELKYGNQ